MNIRNCAYVLGVCGAFVALIGFFLVGSPRVAISQSAGEIHGYAWSETIGWISLNCADRDVCGTSDYRLSIDGDGSISGTAWSEHIGWISADSSDLSGCPQSPCSARMDDVVLSGWLRALSAEDGWDGFISLSGESPSYGPTLAGGNFNGFAWGSDVVGWIDFQYAATSYLACSPPYQCVDATHYDDACTESVESYACGEGLVCGGGVVACVLPSDASGELALNPALVPTNTSTEVVWNVESTISCRVFGDNGDEWFGGGTGSETSSPIIETTLYTLECTNALGEATTTVDTAYATVVPTWVER